MPDRIPPLDTVRAIQAALDDAGILSVVGGSGLLHALGPVDRVNDWDIATAADPDAVARAISPLGLPWEEIGPSGIFATERLYRVDAGDHTIDLLCTFRLRDDERVVEIPVIAGERWCGLRLSAPEPWYDAYRLMGRTGRAARLRSHLDGAS